MDLPKKLVVLNVYFVILLIVIIFLFGYCVYMLRIYTILLSCVYKKKNQLYFLDLIMGGSARKSEGLGTNMA